MPGLWSNQIYFVRIISKSWPIKTDYGLTNSLANLKPYFVLWGANPGPVTLLPCHGLTHLTEELKKNYFTPKLTHSISFMIS